MSLNKNKKVEPCIKKFDIPLYCFGKQITAQLCGASQVQLCLTLPPPWMCVGRGTAVPGVSGPCRDGKEGGLFSIIVDNVVLWAVDTIADCPRLSISLVLAWLSLCLKPPGVNRVRHFRKRRKAMSSCSITLILQCCFGHDWGGIFLYRIKPAVRKCKLGSQIW